MKVIHLNTNDIDGGAAKAAYRIHKGILAQELDCASTMLVQNRRTDDSTVMKLEKGKFNKLIDKFRSHTDSVIKNFYRDRLKVPWSVNYFNNRKIVNYLNSAPYDIVHLHWINNGFISIADICKIKKPIVWTLHDTWPYTGGCHYFGSCDKYREKCYACAQLSSKYKKDISLYLFYKKSKSYGSSNLTIISPSRWMAECAKSSKLMGDKRVEVIPNGLDLNLYRDISKTLAKQILNIPSHKAVIMFGAMSSTSDERKGFTYLREAMLRMRDKINGREDVQLVVFGSDGSKHEEDLGFPILYSGRVYDDVTLMLLYNAADVFIAPSREDNLPNTVVESLACGTPCVAFNIGGMPDMIRHKFNGYLAEPFDVDDLAEGMSYILEDKDRRKTLCQNARKTAEDNFDIKCVSKQYMDLYRGIIECCR